VDELEQSSLKVERWLTVGSQSDQSGSQTILGESDLLRRRRRPGRVTDCRQTSETKEVRNANRRR
jgi:hypothetical protein